MPSGLSKNIHNLLFVQLRKAILFFESSSCKDNNPIIGSDILIPCYMNKSARNTTRWYALETTYTILLSYFNKVLSRTAPLSADVAKWPNTFKANDTSRSR